jgi:hypothetical protein
MLWYNNPDAVTAFDEGRRRPQSRTLRLVPRHR